MVAAVEGKYQWFVAVDIQFLQNFELPTFVLAQLLGIESYEIQFSSWGNPVLKEEGMLVCLTQFHH